MIMQEATSITRLRAAFRRNDITIYVGAGASAASGVPLWDPLLLTVYLNSLKNRYRGFSADDLYSPYTLQATAERWFTKSGVPLDIAARTLRTSFHDPTEFVSCVRFALYQAFEFDSHGYPTLFVQSLVRRTKR